MFAEASLRPLCFVGVEQQVVAEQVFTSSLNAVSSPPLMSLMTQTWKSFIASIYFTVHSFSCGCRIMGCDQP